MNKPLRAMRPSRTCVNCRKNDTLACAQSSEEQPGPAVAVFLLSVCVLFGPLTFMAALAAVVIKHFDKGGR